MVQALLTSIRSMLGSQATQTREFKTEAVKNNKNVFNTIKDISRMFSSQARTDAKQNESLTTIETNTADTSAKVDRVSALMQQSISIQTEMLGELKNLRTLFRNSGSDGGSGSGILGMAGAAALGVGAGLTMDNLMDLMRGNEPSTNQSHTGSTVVSRESFNGGGFEDTGGAGPHGGNRLGTKDMVMLARQAGFSPEEAVIMGAVGAAESSGDVRAHNPDASTGDNSYGLWQINMLGDMGPERRRLFGISENEQLWDPKINAAAARKIYLQQGFDAWSVYKSGDYKKFLGTAAESIKEGDETGVTSSSSGVMPQEKPMGGSGGNVFERQAEMAGVRKLPLNDNLKRVLQQAASNAGVDVEVYSGGQAAKGSGKGPRTGSTRHDNGNAADVYLYQNGRKLRDPEDRETMAKFVSAAAAAGATGLGFGGKGQYMGESGIHVGFGRPATWGGSPWIKQAASGIYSNKDLQSSGGGYDTAGYGMTNQLGMNMMGGTELGNMLSSLNNMFGSFGMGSLLGGNIFGVLSSLFGLPMGGMTGANQPAGYGDNEQETEENEPEDADRRMEEAPPHAAAKAKQQKTAAPVESDYRNYEGITNQIQMAALEDLSRSPVMVERKPETTPYTTNGMKEASTSFGAVPENSMRETRASWAPRIAVLRPGDETKNLTWAARIAPNLA